MKVIHNQLYINFHIAFNNGNQYLVKENISVLIFTTTKDDTHQILITCLVLFGYEGHLDLY
jgi:hypothetical protein